jgi:hypothetical protein
VPEACALLCSSTFPQNLQIRVDSSLTLPQLLQVIMPVFILPELEI